MIVIIIYLLKTPTGVLKSRESELAVCLGGLSEGWSTVDASKFFHTSCIHVHVHVHVHCIYTINLDLNQAWKTHLHDLSWRQNILCSNVSARTYGHSTCNRNFHLRIPCYKSGTPSAGAHNHSLTIRCWIAPNKTPYTDFNSVIGLHMMSYKYRCTVIECWLATTTDALGEILGK